jgi:HK97 gp10 family phage protein
MSRNAFRMTGFKELERALAEELPKATAKNVLWRTAEASMKPLEERMASLAPHDPQDRDGDGKHLNETMRTQRVKATRQAGNRRYDPRSGVEVITGPAPTGKRARANAGWQEDGTANMPAHPYARPAADSEGENIIHSVRDELTAQVGRAKDRIARRAARRS